MLYARLDDGVQRGQGFRRWLRNHIYWFRNDLASIPWHLDTLFGPKRVWELHHFYQHGSVPNTFVIGKGDPANILAYLQLRADKEIDIGCLLFHTEAAKLLQRFYGYRIARSNANVTLCGWIFTIFASGDAASGSITSLPDCFTAAKGLSAALKECVWVS